MVGVRKATVEAIYESNLFGRHCAGYGAYHECGWQEHLTAWHNAFWAADHHMRYDCGRREPSSGELRPAPETHEWDSCPYAYEEDAHAGHVYKRFDEQKVWCPGPTAKTGAYIEGTSDGNPRMPDGSPDMGALHGLMPGQPWVDGPHEVEPEITAHKQTYYEVMSTERYEEKLAEAQALDQYLERCVPGHPPWSEWGNEEAWAKARDEGGMRTTPTPSDMGHPLPPESTEGPTVELGAITSELGPVVEGVAIWEDGATDRGHTGWWAGLWGRGHGRQG